VDGSHGDRGDIDRVATWLRAARRVTALTGAGISTESGIPDFRGPQGVWTRDPAAEAASTLDRYLAEPEVRVRTWRGRLENPAWAAQPNAGHRALVDLERAGRLRAIVTQNVDGLHQRSGSSPDIVIEVHGTMYDVVCMSCGRRTSMRDNLDRVESGEPDPDCLACGGIQKSATISFGQQLDPAVFAAAERAARSADLLLAVGTSLQVYPVAGLVDDAARAGALVVIVNAEPTPYDGMAAAVLRDPIGEVLPRLVAAAAA
jgi:NAD-dependent deacetylase